MRKQFCLPILLFVVIASVEAQQKFRYDRTGLVTDRSFSTLLKKRGYQLAGLFDTVSTKPLKVYATVVRNFRYGYIDPSGREVVAPVYDIVQPFYEGKAIVKKNGRYGIIDLEGQTVVPLNYEFIQTAMGGYTFEQNGKEGKMDASGRITKPATKRVYEEEITDEPRFQSTVESNDGPFRFRAASNDYLVLQEGRQVGIVPNYGKPSIINYSAVLFRNAEGKYGVVGFKGETLLPFDYDGIWPLNHSGDYLYNGIYGLREGKLTGVADKQGKVIIEPAWDEITTLPGRHFRAGRSGQYTLLDSLGQPLTAEWFEDISLSYTSRLIYVKRGGKWAFAATNGKLLSGFDYNAIDLFSIPPYIKVQQGSKYGVLDTNLRSVLPVVYDGLRGSCRSEGSWTTICRDNYVYLEQGGKQGVMNSEGKIILPLKFDRVKFEFEDLFVVKEAGKWGVMSGKGQYIIPAMYENELAFHAWLTRIKINQKWGLADSSGKVVLRPEYDYILYYNEEKGIIQADLQDRTIFVDRYGNKAVRMAERREAPEIRR